MAKEKKHPVFQAVKAFVRMVFPKYETIGLPEHLAYGQSVFVANHLKATGPVAMCVCFKRNIRPWVIDQVCHVKTFPAFARADFWHPKNPLTKGLVWVLSYLLAPVGAWVFRRVGAIPAHFDRRAVETIKESIDALEEGNDIVLFPENRTPFSPYNEDFSSGFVYIAKRFYRKTGKRITFFPVYISQTHKGIYVGKGILYDPQAPDRAERECIKNALRDAMTEMGASLQDPPTYSL